MKLWLINVNAILISPAIKHHQSPAYSDTSPMALISIATFLSRYGHNVKVIDRLREITSIDEMITN
jgi:hypothetical protein